MKTKPMLNMRTAPLIWVCCLITLLLQQCFSFQFKAVDVLPDTSSVSAVTSYTINAYRYSTEYLDPTNWDLEPVPSGGTVVVKFPLQYTLVGPVCDSVEVTTQSQTLLATGFNCTILGRQLTINNLFASATFVKSLVIRLSNILNPPLAITTDSFIVRIGNDNSGDTPMASVIITPTKFSLINTTFDNKTVNTTGSLIVTFASKNIIKSGSSVVIEFPPTLQWARDISSTHPLPLNSVLNCAGLTSNLRSTISCAGSLTQRSITLSNINSGDISINNTVQFRVGQLFSPPSTEEIDEISIKIKSQYTDGFFYEMDSDKSKITGMVPKTMSVAFSSTSRVTVNSKIAIQLDIVLADTINQLDTLRVYFPAVCNFALSDTRSSTSGFFINSTSSTYDPVNRILQMRQRTQTQVNFANKAISLQMSLFTVPPSTKQFGITFQILRQNFTMAQGVVYTNALTNSYTGNVSAVDLGVNKVTRYDVVVDVKDNHLGTMMVEIVLPSTLTVNPSTFSAKTSLSSSVIPAFSLTGTTQTTITLTNLIAPSNTTILPQNLTITLYNITNPSSVKGIGNFVVRTYYNSDVQEKVSESTIATTLTTVNGQIAESNVKLVPGSGVNYEPTAYGLQFVVENAVDINGYFVVSLPSELDLAQLTSVRLTTTLISNQPIQFSPINTTSLKLTNNISRLSSSSQLNLTLTNIRNPSSTKPTAPAQVKIQSFNSIGQLIDLLNPSNSLGVQMTTVNGLKSARLDRGSVKNDETTVWRVNFTQVQSFEVGQVVVLAVDSSAIVGSAISCIDTLTSINLTCSKLASRPVSLSSFSSAKLSSSYISVTIPPSYTNQSTFLFTIQPIQNPPSYLPFAISLFTTSSDFTYPYSTVQQSYQNSQLSNIVINSYSFSKRQLKESTVLAFGYGVVSGFGSLVVEFDAGFGLGSVTCASAQWPDMVCTVINNTTIKLNSSNILSLSPKTATITLINLITPSTQSPTPLYTRLSTFDLFSQPMGSNTNSISYSLQCALPCKTCSTTNISQCLSCYKSPISLKEFLGVDKKCYQQCPDGYNENTDTYSCEKCSSPCMYCNNLKTNCTACNSSSEFVYLSYTITSDTSTCVKTCPSKYYPDSDSVPVYCQPCKAPCLQCTSQSFCLSCLQSTNQSLYLYNGTCVRTCPADVTVINPADGSCVLCSPECKTCSVITTNCTTCADMSIFYQGKCLISCPSPLIKYNSACASCDAKCQFCSITPTNCTSCVKTSSFPLFYANDCLSQCPNFYYPSTNKLCLQCNTLGIGCKNCTNETSCRSCDGGYVLLGDKCLTTVPIGYINSSGVAVPCAGDCKTCVGTVENCTSCKTLNLNGNLCQSTCPPGQTSVNQVCTRCQYPCQSCSSQTYLCTSCFSNSSTFLYNSECLLNCPDKFYKNATNMSCLACRMPCEKCLDDVTCVSCVAGYYFYGNTSQCLVGCPSGMVGENRVCVQCSASCATCSGTRTTCQSCTNGYFLSSTTNQCLTQCPSGSIKNQTSRTCQACISPCLTCLSSPTQCLTCTQNHFLLDSQCYSSCPQYYYPNSTKCLPCSAPCLTCSSSTVCLSCAGALYLHRQECVVECPKEYGRVSNGSCSQCDNGCYACESSGTCTECSAGYIFYLDQCYTSCPSNYISTKVNSTLTCVLKQQSDTKLESTLTSSSNSLFPLPFTILGLIIIGAGLISKLQNRNTYLIGLAYSVFGVLETGAVLYVLYDYFFKYQQYEMLTVYLILAGLGLFAALNVFAFLVNTAQLCSDKRFECWVKSSCFNSMAFFFTTLFSLAVNYKFKLIIFCKIFNFNVFKAELTSVEKFKIFNIFSFLGIFGEAELIYALIRQVVVKKDFSNDLFLTFVDCLVILGLNVVFSIASSWKSDDFFTEEIDGIFINKKVFIEGDIINKQALKDQQEYHPYFSTRKTFNDSKQVLKNTSNVIDEFNDEYEESGSEEYQTNKNSKEMKTKDKLYFEDEDLSSQTLRYKEDLDVSPSKRSQIDNKKQSVFDKGIQQEEETEKHHNEFQPKNQDYDISSNTERQENRSVKKSENVFCISPRKRQKQNDYSQSEEKKAHYSEEEEDEKAKKMRKNKDIEDSASHFNKVMKHKEMKEMLNEDSTKQKPSSKSRKSKKSRQLSNKSPSTKNKPNSEENQQKNPSSKKLLLELNDDGSKLESSHDSEHNRQHHQPDRTRLRFEEVSRSLKESEDVLNALQEQRQVALDENNQIRKIQIISQNSSKTYALPLHLSPANNNSAIIDSQSQTVCQDGRLRPQKRQNSIQQIQTQNKIKINTMHYEGEENSINEEEAPKSRTHKPKYDREEAGERSVRYDYVEEREQREEREEQNLVSIPVLIEKYELASSEQSYQMEEIEKNPLGYSPESRIIQNKEESRDVSQDEMLLQLHSHMKSQNSNLQEGKTLQLDQNRLQTINQVLLTQTPLQTLSKQASDPSHTKQTNNNNSLKQKYEEITNKVHSLKETKAQGKRRSLNVSEGENVVKRQSDVFVSNYLEEGEVPIKKREQRFERERKYPIQRRSKDRFESNNTPGIQSKTESQFQLSPSKLSPNRRINIDNSNLLTPVYRSNPADVIIQNAPHNNNKTELSAQKLRPIYQSSNIEFDPVHERIHTNTIFGDELRDELDNFSMKQVKFEKSGQYVPTSYANEALQGARAVDVQEFGRNRMNSLISTDLIPRPNIQRFTSPIYQHSPENKNHGNPQDSPTFTITNSKSLASYYGINRLGRQIQSKQKSREKNVVRSKSRDGSNYGRANLTRSPQKEAQRLYSGGKEAKNQISSNRLKELEKIYLQRLH